MPKLILGDQTLNRLRGWAIAREDTLDDVLQRVLDAADRQRELFLPEIQPDIDPDEEQGDDTIRAGDPIDHVNRTGAPVEGEPTPSRAYRQPLLESLYEMGGRAESREVLARIEQKMERVLTTADYGTTTGRGHTVWHNRASWMRKRLVDEGMLSKESPRGVWELTPLGVSEIERLL